jgi:hypothetical protein
MAAVLDRLHIDVAQITDLLVAAEFVNICKIAAGVDNVDEPILADNLLRLGHIDPRAD